MTLSALWFILIAVLFAGYFFLEGFDFGVGMLLPVLGRDEADRKRIASTIAPFWDANEVWLITAGGAIFAAFPHWYATFFSGFYLALLLLLVALIARGIGLEYGHQSVSEKSRRRFDLAVGLGSLVAPLLVGVAITDFLIGVPIDQQKQFAGGFFDLLQFDSVIGGLLFVALFLYHGLVFLSLRLSGALQEKAMSMVRKSGIAAIILLAFYALRLTTVPAALKGAGLLIAGVSVICLIGSLLLMMRQSYGKAFIASACAILSLTGALFTMLFPNVMVSNLNPAYNLTVQSASSSPYTLKIMTIVACSLLPILLAYQVWNYWIFIRRVKPGEPLEY